jgi:hypothetical protein
VLFSSSPFGGQEPEDDCVVIGAAVLDCTESADSVSGCGVAWTAAAIVATGRIGNGN